MNQKYEPLQYISCGLDEKGMVNGACKIWMTIIPGAARMQELRM